MSPAILNEYVRVLSCPKFDLTRLGDPLSGRQVDRPPDRSQVAWMQLEVHPGFEKTTDDRDE